MIQQHLALMAQIGSEQQRAYFRWLLATGRQFPIADKMTLSPAEISDTIKPKMCFANATLTTFHEDLDYVEGYYVTEFPIAFEHAFNLRDGRVVDVTADKVGIAVTEYFGVTLSKELIREYVLSSCPDWVMPLRYFYETRIVKSKQAKKWQEE